MAPPRRQRTIRGIPHSNHFAPTGLTPKEMVVLTKEEYEAIRLIDREELTQQEAAKLMRTSQATLSRLLSKGRKKVADAFAEGKAIVLGSTIKH